MIRQRKRMGTWAVMVAAALATAVFRADLAPADTPAAPAVDTAGAPVAPATRPVILFSTNFQGGMLGKVEAIDTNTYRCAVPGQYNEQGRNRQTSWYYFRMENVRDRPLTLTLTDLIGEYNNRPGAVPHGPDNGPAWSADGKRWAYFTPEQFTWDNEKKEGTVRYTPESDTIWIAIQPPYTPADLERLLEDIGRSAFARIEVIGKTAGGRDLPMVTVTDFSVADDAKKCVWLQARQHAWEAGTSYVMSDDPKAIALRKTTVFRFTPMIDLDGCAAGKVRFNANGYDLNRNWLSVDLRNPEMLRRMPEIWYGKKAVAAAHAAGPKIALMVNLHNTETGEYLQTAATDDEVFGRFSRLYDALVERTQFDPSQKFQKPNPKAIVQSPNDTANSLWQTHGVPVALMELRTSTVKKLGRRPMPEDRAAFGRELITEMAEAAGR